jgi:hypothetical protein
LKESFLSDKLCAEMLEITRAHSSSQHVQKLNVAWNGAAARELAVE